ncbi:hypothetical protein HMPREF3159_03715 [Brachybacterium sp. HMSC06H03]|uniref:hypothetical protein n=1 Tax=Brachybacterium sp. HMSC06H03 TaxID=1581127 RepID=UPI0008A48067|nr:hypothetical protein [Brachybacterium sp. HMSC06H03]OFT62629.1 hypothetical protein HMPREF3159_03715 [Brachybacterium sp. HMSC06H03]
MSMDVAISFLMGLVVAGAGAALLLLAAWFRWGRSTAARRWARRIHIDQAANYAAVEALALAWTPMIAQTLLLAAPAIPLVALLGRGSEAASTVIGVLVIVELVLWMAMLLLTVYRWILPLWMYPAWLRETRRAEVEHLKAQRGRRR